MYKKKTVILYFADFTYANRKKLMQTRHTDRRSYFNELAVTSEKYYIPYIAQKGSLKARARVLEIGCGEGGNLAPFARLGCDVTGVDIVPMRIEQARAFFAEDGLGGTFVCSDIFKADADLNFGGYDLVLCHDVIEHIPFKDRFLQRVNQLLAPGGRAFFGFPAWQMPFGGHQQICRSRFCSHAPFIHLLPVPLYRALLRTCGVKEKDVAELLSIKECRQTIENFQRTARRQGLKTVNRQCWLINPHYETKFGLRPRRLWPLIAAIPYVRNYFSTSVFYLLEKQEQA